MPITEADGGPAPELATERLILRPITSSDWPDVLRLAGDNDVARWTASLQHPLSEQDAKTWIERRTQRQTSTGVGYVFSVISKDDGAFIGVTGFHTDSGTSRADIGYWFGKPFWGQGYATEALFCALEFAFDKLGHTVVAATAFPDNGASMRVLEKAGFKVMRRDKRDIQRRGGVREFVQCEVDKAGFDLAVKQA
ncbi:MAG: ribosomal-protein-alanine N-acetyltransferase [Alphaproteobacteria bacterium]|jgi:ribosomal-protein-alanine N-acetyltransferase